MSYRRSFTNPLFLDIETVPVTKSYDLLGERMKKQWLRKAGHMGAETEKEKADLFAERAGIFAEFGKIVSIAVGYVAQSGPEDYTMQVKGLYDDDEKKLLLTFKQLLTQFSEQHPLQLCAHNGKEFDFPYLARRMVTQNIPLPSVLDTAGKKPWEVAHLDTLELWKFGDRKNYTSLELLGALLEVPSSKELMDGSEVAHYYYEKNDLKKISDYCRLDVVATIQIFRRMRFLPFIAQEQIILS